MKHNREGRVAPLSIKRVELANSATHGLGTVGSIVGLTMLLLKATRLKNGWMFAGFLVYGISLILLFLSSTLYHAMPFPRLKSLFRLVDHGSIYILIAGTYTPFTLVSLRGPWGWSIFGTIWGLALAGVLFDSFSKGHFRKIGTATYILMGWLSLILLPKLFFSLGLAGLITLLIGGLLYTLGVVFYAWKDLTYNHVIWHLFVLAGGACHFLTVYLFVTPT